MDAVENKASEVLENLQRQTTEKTVERFHRKPIWWREVIFVGLLYGLYSFVRNLNGSNVNVDDAKAHAIDVVNAEKWLHIYNELQIQNFFLDHARWFIKFLNVWYGTAHFIVTIGALLWLYFKFPNRYHKWRNVIFGTTFFALIGYVIYPLAPPRLLPEAFGFEDTLKTIGGLWDFNSEAVEEVSNQYAAMPSLHVGWALWCAFSLVPILKHRLTRALMTIYPAITITAIVATANHYWMDVFGGAFVFSIGYMLAETNERRRNRTLINSGQLTAEEIAELRKA